MSIGKHILVILAFTSVAVGQTLFGLGAHAEALGGALYLIGAANIAVMVGLAYLNLCVLTPHLLLRGRYVEYLSTLTGGVFAYLVLKWMSERWLLGRVGIEWEFNFVTVLDWLSNLAMFVIFLVSGSAMLLFRQWIADTRRIDEMENNRLQSSVDEFKNRLNAPLLYRVLGYAARKVKSDPERVSEIIFSLSERLRRDLYDDKR